MPNISVIVPVYKVETFLHRCVDSILGQTETDFELILVDDGSPDRCGAICEEYAAADPRVRVIHRENGGLSAARNTGIDWAFANSDSRWLCFVDSDDWIHPRYLEILLKAVRETGCPVGICGFFRTAGDPIPEDRDETVYRLTADEYYCGSLHDGLTAVAWNKLYDKQLFANLRYPVGKLHEDEFTTYRALYAAGSVAAVPARCYAYFQNPQGIMGAPWSPRRLHMLEAFAQQADFAREQGSDRLKQKTAVQFLYAAYEQIGAADTANLPTVRRYLRQALKMGRACGAFPMERKNLWAYEAAYPMKPLWWLISKLPEGSHE